MQMFPHQSQGACMAIEDAAALGILFSKPYFDGNIADTLQVYQEIRLPRATKVQAAAARAAVNINERIGTSRSIYAFAIRPSTDTLLNRILQQYRLHRIHGGR